MGSVKMNGLVVILSLFIIMGIILHYYPLIILQVAVVKKTPFYNLHNFSKPIMDNHNSDTFNCDRTKAYNPNFKICLYNPSNDVHISGTINRGGVWEGHIYKNIKIYLDKDPEIGFIDIGANIGSHSLYAAVRGHQVVAVEPVTANIRRLHKSVLLNGVQDKFILLENAVFNKRTELKIALDLSEISNQGAHRVFGNSSLIHTPTTVIQAILIDDLLQVINFSSAILKIDIEGSEPEALLGASKLFAMINIPIIFIEWGQVKKRYKDMDLGSEAFNNVGLMIRMLTELGYTPKDTPNGKALTVSEWGTTWPWDIVFENQHVHT